MLDELRDTYLDDSVQISGRSFKLLKEKVEDGSITVSGGQMTENIMLSGSNAIKGDFSCGRIQLFPDVYGVTCTRFD